MALAVRMRCLLFHSLPAHLSVTLPSIHPFHASSIFLISKALPSCPPSFLTPDSFPPYHLYLDGPFLHPLRLNLAESVLSSSRASQTHILAAKPLPAPYPSVLPIYSAAPRSSPYPSPPTPTRHRAWLPYSLSPQMRYPASFRLPFIISSLEY